MIQTNDPEFSDVIEGLIRGDFSRLEPAMDRVPLWFEEGLFEGRQEALNEALTCASFNGNTKVARFLLDNGVDPAMSAGTGFTALHWAADRGQLETVRLLLERNAPLEVKNMYGGTILGFTVWSAQQKRRPNHLNIIQLLLDAGADINGADYPTGEKDIDKLLSQHGAM